MTSRSTISALCMLSVCAAALSPAAVAHAAIFTVTSTTDAVDASPGNGVCATASNVCTLRAAIQESNALAGKDTIRLAAATYTLTRAGANENAASTGDLDINENLDIKGEGPTVTIINANGLDRAFDCGPGPVSVRYDVRISGLRIRNGGAFTGGGIDSTCKLSLTDVSFRDNHADLGGAISTETYWMTNPLLDLLRVEVRGNEATVGGGISPEGPTTVTIRESEFRENISQTSGGAISASGSTVFITDSVFHENAAITFSAVDATFLYIDHSTFSANTAAASAGTVLVGNQGEIVNSTFYDNWAPLGGAVTTGGSGSAIVNNCTFSFNLATDYNNEDTTGASIAGDDITVGNSVFEFEQPNACSVYSELVSLGFNRVGDESCGFASTGDVETLSLNDLEEDLADNGGPTPTLKLFDQAFSIDHASPDVPGSSASSSEPTDQRYVTRPVRGFFEVTTPRSDQGAFEKCLAAGGPDSDGDGQVDACDADDDDDGCLDAHDTKPLVSTVAAGSVIDFCEGGSHAWYAFEGADPDNDGLFNCEDPDDDDDGLLDASDPCSQSVAPACILPGKYPCWPRWMECLGGSCVERFLKFYEVINPARQLRFERFEAWNETLYMAPLAGQTAPQSIAAFASNAPATQGVAATRSAFAAPSANMTAAAPAAAAAPLRLTGRVRIESWSRATRMAPERLIATVGEYDASRVRVGSLTTGNVIVLEPPADSRSVLATSTTWADGGAPTQLGDFDDDGIPNAFDNCGFVSNRDQRDQNRDGIGDACVLIKHAR